MTDQFLATTQYLSDIKSKNYQTYITNPSRDLVRPLKTLIQRATWRENMVENCKLCGSNKIKSKGTARKIGGLVGGIGGAVSGATGAASGAEVGAIIGAVGGPAGIALGSIAGALLGGLFGGAAGGIAGAAVGEQVDERVLENYQCLECGYSFTKDRT